MYSSSNFSRFILFFVYDFVSFRPSRNEIIDWYHDTTCSVIYFISYFRVNRLIYFSIFLMFSTRVIQILLIR